MPPRDLSTRLARLGRLSLLFEPRDVWVGAFIGPDALYVALLPCLVLKRTRLTAASRDLSTRLFRRGRFSVIFEPRNAWAGGFAGPKAAYLTVIPCLSLRWERRAA